MTFVGGETFTKDATIRPETGMRRLQCEIFKEISEFEFNYFRMAAFYIRNIKIFGPTSRESKTDIDLRTAEQEDLTLAALKFINGHNHEPVSPISFPSIRFILILINHKPLSL
jgi:hypothetical protein